MLKTQQKITSQIQEIEKKFESLQEIIDKIPQQKEGVFKHHL